MSMNYRNRASAKRIVSVTPHHGSDANLAVQGEVMSSRVRPGRKSRFEATIHDGTGTMLLTWFNATYLRKKIHPGMMLRAWGKTKRWGDYLQMVNPRWEADRAGCGSGRARGTLAADVSWRAKRCHLLRSSR
jgi:ATP-dependent DNA helicase RecG